MLRAIFYVYDAYFCRDLKTANIFLNIDGSVKVGDFGLSKLLTTRIWTDTVLGTPFYLSPEMVKINI